MKADKLICHIIFLFLCQTQMSLMYTEFVYSVDSRNLPTYAARKGLLCSNTTTASHKANETAREVLYVNATYIIVVKLLNDIQESIILGTCVPLGKNMLVYFGNMAGKTVISHY